MFTLFAFQGLYQFEVLQCRHQEGTIVGALPLEHLSQKKGRDRLSFESFLQRGLDVLVGYPFIAEEAAATIFGDAQMDDGIGCASDLVRQGGA